MTRHAILRLGVLGLGALLAVSLPAQATGDKRAVILGFDGMDPDLVTEFGAKELPHLHALMATSGALELGTTTPAESPVSWAAMITGRSPGETGIYDFIYHERRDASGTPPANFGYRPIYALVRVVLRDIVSARDRALLAAGIGLLAFLLAAAVCALLGLRRRRTIIIALSLGVAAGAAAGYLLQTWLSRPAPAAESRMQSRPFWERAVVAGRRVRALTVPMTFPAGCACEGDLRILAGLGVPDVRGTNGTFHVWSSAIAQQEDTEFGGLLRSAQATVARQILSISGPVNWMAPAERAGQRVESTFEIELIQGQGLSINVPGQPTFELEQGHWSPQVAIEFRINFAVRLTGLARFYLKERSDRTLTLYLSPMSFHPEHVPPTVAISHPHGYAAELARAIGPFKTLGWAVDTWGLADGWFDEETFREDLRFTFEQHRELLRHELARDEEWDLLMMVFEETDRASHMLWNHRDPDHPRYEPVPPGGTDGILDTYRWADEIVGETLARYAGDPDTLVLVVSDHGFASFARCVNLNTWLQREKYLQLGAGAPLVQTPTLNQLFGGDESFKGVDWRQTRAFALGLGTVYLNTFGLDPEPCVQPSEAEGLAAEIADKLLALADPDHPDRKVVASVAWKRRAADGKGYELVSGSPPGTRISSWGRDAPELVVGFEPGYRVGWGTTLGGLSATVFEDNLSPWSGDHCSVDPAQVAGVILANHPLAATDTPHVLDIAPTVLSWFGLAHDDLSGRSLVK